MKIVDLRTEDGRLVARAGMACTFRNRCLGLIRRRALEAEEGLLLVPGGGIHTVGMRFAIDVVFMDKALRIVGLRPRVPPWRFVCAPQGTRFALELCAGRIVTLGLGLRSPVQACFDDEESEEASSGPPRLRLRTRLPLRRLTRTERGCTQSRPADCIAFTLRLPLRFMPRGLHTRQHYWRRVHATAASRSDDPA